MAKKSLPLSEAYRLLEPGPVVLLTTAGDRGPNVMAMSWHMMMDFEPPVLACVVSSRDYTFEILKKTGECAISIPTVEIAKKVVGCGNTSGRTLDKFETFGLTPSPASRIKAPLIDECFASLECKVIDSSWSEKYNVFVLEVLQAWIDPRVKNPKTLHHRGKGFFMVAGRTIKLPSKMK
jgi:flavin reductase (DIM6/NTAB) family NADH-FMN oxidoreductase RutF